jgi:sugar phosphate isomerase/epimerase
MAAAPSFLIGFQSYSLRHFQQLELLLAQAEKLGLGYVELYRGHLATDASPERIEAVKAGLKELGITVNAFGVEEFTADHEKNEALFRFGKELGVMNLSANPTKDAFPSLEKLVDQYDIRIAIHNHGPEDERWRRPEWILKAVRDLDPRIGACVDTGHYFRAGVDAVEAIEMLGARVLGVHLKDFTKDSQEVIIGDGQLDLSSTLSALHNVGFKGPFSLEYEESEEDPVPDMLEAVRRVKAGLESV